jgi:hypothetical protein
MADEKQEQPAADKDEPTEKTMKGMTVRTPTRGEFFKNLEKVSKTQK